MKISCKTFKAKDKEDVKEFLKEFKEEVKPFEVYEIGDKIGQIIILPYPQIEFEEAEELSETERNTGGYGSTGN